MGELRRRARPEERADPGRLASAQRIVQGDVFQLGLPQLQTWDGTTPSAAVQLQTKEAATGLLALASRLPSSALTLVGGTVVLGATANLALAAFGHHVDVSVFIV